MKRFITIILFFLIFQPVLLQGQENKLNIGISGGPSMKWMYYKNYHWAPGIGYSGDFSFQYNLTQRISLRTAIAFEKKGEHRTVGVTDEWGHYLGTRTYNYSLDYLVIPLLFRFNVIKPNYLFIDIGPYTGYLMCLSYKTYGALGDDKSKCTKPDEFNRKFDWGLSAGIGTEVPIADKISLMLETKYNRGLYDINKSKYSYARTNSVTILLGIEYHLAP